MDSKPTSYFLLREDLLIEQARSALKKASHRSSAFKQARKIYMEHVQPLDSKILEIDIPKAMRGDDLAMMRSNIKSIQALITSDTLNGIWITGSVPIVAGWKRSFRGSIRASKAAGFIVFILNVIQT